MTPQSTLIRRVIIRAVSQMLAKSPDGIIRHTRPPGDGMGTVGSGHAGQNDLGYFGSYLRFLE
jgi:hypothetical protein